MTTSESLAVYWGGFLYNSVAPLEITLNRCSHGCVYCFANLNNPDRRSNAAQADRLLDEYQDETRPGVWKRKSYAAHLLREGYGVSISNRVDPLARSNWLEAKPLIKKLVEKNIHIAIMTRFGDRASTEELFSLLTKPTSFYVSIPTLSEAIAAKCEPNAPPPQQRLEYIKQAIALGHTVNVGINPLIPGWIDDIHAHAKTLKDAGVWGVCLGKLHLSQRQRNSMSEATRKALGEEAIAHASKHRRSQVLEDLYQEADRVCNEYGLHTYTAQQGNYSRYWEAYKGGDRQFPFMQAFVNHCHQTKQSGDLIQWEEFRDFFVPQLPEGEFGLRDHLNSVANQQSLYGLNIPQRMTYEQLLWYCWKYEQTIFCPATVECFAWAGDRVPKKRNHWIRVEDDAGMPILVFQPTGTTGQLYTEDHSL